MNNHKISILHMLSKICQSFVKFSKFQAEIFKQEKSHGAHCSGM